MIRWGSPVSVVLVAVVLGLVSAGILAALAISSPVPELVGLAVGLGFGFAVFRTNRVTPHR